MPPSRRPSAPTKTKVGQTEAAKRDIEEKASAALFQGSFRAQVLAGDTVNEFRVNQPANRLGTVTTTVKWQSPTGFNTCPDPCQVR